MKKYLLPETGKFYKANLHCHTTVSDGSYTPEQVKDAYKNHGYSVVAYTDHNVLISQNHLTDGDFLALNGYELNAAGENGQTCHMNFIALDPDNLTQVCYHREKYLFANAVKYRNQLKFDESLPDYERVHTPEKISEMMRMGRDGGFFVVYNHPAWSMESPEQYTNYHGMHAMEIHNTGCLRAGYNDYNEKEYDHILRAGERVFCIAADDNHNRYPLESHLSDSFGGFTMIKAEKLEYKAVTDALLAGHFYASQGPEICDLWYEDGKVHITCSPAQMVIVSGDRRKTDFVSVPAGEALTEATLTVNKEYKYFRVTVIDENGRRANTNAYFLDEVCK